MSPWQDVLALGGPQVGEILQAEMAVKGSNLLSTAGPMLCTCRLEMTFVENGGTMISQGTGFLVSLPERYKKDVIMTAGHNLVSSNGVYAKSIDVEFFGSAPVTVRRDKNQYFASQSYERMPNAANGVNDYGIIMIVKGEVKYYGGHPGGFGYSLLVPKEELIGVRATVYGYPVRQGEQRPGAYHAFGKIIAVGDGRIEYGLTTLGGHSGGPVCVEREGSQGTVYTVVGIHNYGSVGKNIGSLLTCDILMELFAQLEEKRSLEVGLKHGATNIFLKIPPASGSKALVRQSRDRYTNVSFFPVETYSKEDGPSPPPKCVIATSLLRPVTYLEFYPNGASGDVRTVRGEDFADNRPTEKNVVIMEHGTSGTTLWFQISTFKTAESQYLLRVNMEEFNKRAGSKHGCDCTAREGPDVELIRYPGKTKATYSKFVFT